MKPLFSMFISSLIFLPTICMAEVRMPRMFSDNMVIQRDQPIRVWGWADKGSTVIVELNGIVTSGTVNEQGQWAFKLPPLRDKGPYELVVRQGNTVTFKNILAGEVWLCSGQSNMEWLVRNSNNPEEEIKSANFPEIRHILVGKKVSTSPLEDIESTGWQVCSPETAGSFTAVGYYFARNLHQELNVPIGLIHSSWGGTICEAWTSGSALKQLPDFKPVVEQIEAQSKNLEAARKTYDQQLQAWQAAYHKAVNTGAPPWHEAGFDDTPWKAMRLPGLWESTEMGNYDGFAWFRRTVNIPEGWAGKEATLSLGPIDDNDWTYANGVQVGHTANYIAKRNYKIPANQVKAGALKIAVRVQDTGGAGGIWGAPGEMKLTQAGQPDIPLSGDWKYRISDAMKNLPPKPEPVAFSGPNTATALYNGMIAPLISYRIQGAIWYQGESNASRGRQYRTLFPTMINDWRARWKQGDFPFYFVQLANFMEPKQEPAESPWAELREAQLMTLSLPNTGQAVAIDIGDAKDIHPRNKQEVGRRLALNALAKTYGKSMVFSGPQYREMKIEGNKIKLTFDHVGSGLIAQDGEPLKYFSIAGADKKFRWADAKIDGAQVVVSHAEVKEPKAVRYAWADNPEGANLYNKDGLPATPFRTDSE